MEIIIVDDSKAIHSLLTDMLNKLENTKLTHLYNGNEAVNFVSNKSFKADLILLDWEMPELNGIDALSQIRKLHKEIPVIMVTSKNSMQDISEAMERGATDYIMKPFTKDILINKIQENKGKELYKI